VGPALLGALLLLGSVDLHPAGESHSAITLGAGLAGGSHYVPEARHPSLPLHLEAGKLQQRPQCGVCLLRAETRADRPRAVSLGLPEVRPLPLPAAEALPARRAGRTRGARAPPLS
jgi:hypothetical protein